MSDPVISGKAQNAEIEAAIDPIIREWGKIIADGVLFASGTQLRNYEDITQDRILESARSRLLDAVWCSIAIAESLFIPAAVKAEREACAKIAENTKSFDDAIVKSNGISTSGERIAYAIRARGENGNG